MKFQVFAAASLLGVTASATALAQQPWIRDRRYGEGMGVRAGNLEFHPSIAAEVGYDSNYFQRADDGTPEEDPISFVRLRLTPSFTVKTLGSERREALGAGPGPAVTFAAGAHLSFNELIATTPDEIDAASGKTHSDVASDQRHIAAGAGFQLHVLPERPWSFDMYGDWLRTIEPSNDVIESLAFDRDTIRAGAGIDWKPGGGLFDWRLGYELMLNLFERDQFQLYNNVQHAIKTQGRWRFLPKTAVRYDGEYRFVRFAKDVTSQNDGETVQARLGLQGLITYHFALLAMGGWAASFYRDRTTSAGTFQRRNYDDFVGQAEIKWFLMPQPELEATSATVGLSTIALGYTRNFTTSYLGAYYRRDRGYLNFSYFIGGVAVIGLEGGLSHITYPDVTAPGGIATPSFWENRIDAQLFGEYRLSDIFALNTTLSYDQSIVESGTLVRTTVGGTPDNIEFKRFQAWLGARLFW